MEIEAQPEEGVCLRPPSLPGAEPGPSSGSAVSLPLLDPPSLYLYPGLWARLTPRGRQVVLSSLQRTGWGVLAIAVADRLHPGWAHFITRRAWPGLAASVALGKSVLCTTLSHLPFHPESYASTQVLAALPAARAWLSGCPATARLSPGLTLDQRPWQGLLWAGISYCPQWQCCLEVNIGITIPGYPACHFTNILSPKPLNNPMRQLL